MGRIPYKLKTPEQITYAAKAKQVEEFQKKVNAAALAEAARLREENEEYANFGLKTLNIAYVKSHKGISKAYQKIAYAMSLPNSLNKTQKAILQDVQGSFPDIPLRPNIWNKKLISGLRRKIETTIKGIVGHSIDLRGCKTLAQMRKKVKAVQQIASGVHTFKTTITITKEAVVIGKASYPIMHRPSGDKTYPCIRIQTKNKGRCWVRVDGLVAALINQ